LVLPGIAQAGEFMLSNLCKAIFLDPRESLPPEFISKAFQLVSSTLRVLDAATRRAGLRRGIAPRSNLSEPIVVPDAARLSQLKKSVVFTEEEIGFLLHTADLPANSLEPLIVTAGSVSLDDYDVVNGPLLWRPFVKCNGTIILVIPGMVVSAIRQALLRLAYEANFQSIAAESYNKAVWQNVEQSLTFTRNMRFPHHPSGPLNIPCASDGFFSLDHDKVLYCLLVTDPLTRPATSDPFGLWVDDALSDAIHRRLSEVEKDVLTANPAPNDLFLVLVFQGLGGAAAFGMKRTPAGSPSIALSGEAFRVISLVEGGIHLLYSTSPAGATWPESGSALTRRTFWTSSTYTAKTTTAFISRTKLGRTSSRYLPGTPSIFNWRLRAHETFMLRRRSRAQP
jgi:hypothetical protein